MIASYYAVRICETQRIYKKYIKNKYKIIYLSFQTSKIKKSDG